MRGNGCKGNRHARSFGCCPTPGLPGCMPPSICPLPDNRPAPQTSALAKPGAFGLPRPSFRARLRGRRAFSQTCALLLLCPAAGWECGVLHPLYSASWQVVHSTSGQWSRSCAERDAVLNLNNWPCILLPRGSKGALLCSWMKKIYQVYSYLLR
jgi:hypothetical protein